MFEEKESMWKKKGFYVSVCTALVCLLAIGTTYYRMNNDPQGGGFMKAEVESSDAPEDSMQPVGNSKDQSIADKNKATIAPSIPSDTPQPKATKNRRKTILQTTKRLQQSLVDQEKQLLRIQR